MKKLPKILKRYSFFLLSSLILILVFFFNWDLGAKSFISAQSSFIQMLSVLPPIMILLGLIDVWVPREALMKYMGKDAGFTGVLIAILIGSIAAGPMYAAFPFTAVLLKKGVKFSNIIIFMNAWCVTKISTLLFEISAIGYTFTLARLIIDVPGVIIMGYLVERFMGKEDLDNLYLRYDT
ncbi:permease [Clostridium sp.]|uniref:permease n=1 Tax=Clostridium sp. TaxID=1506 RepID=UPI0032163963